MYKILNIARFKSFYFFIIILIISNFFFKTLYNTYLITQRAYEERLIRTYGYCEKESYGFVSYIFKKYKINKEDDVQILNMQTAPPITTLITKNKELKNKTDKFYLILNFEEKENYNIEDLNLTDWNNFKLIEKYGNCFFYKYD